MYYQGPTINPGVELSIAAGGKLMQDVSRPIDAVVNEVLEAKYRPKNEAAMKKMTSAFSRCESAYFGGWNEKRIAEHDKMPAPGELHLGPLFGDSPGAATYLNEPFLDKDGRKAFRDALLISYDEITSCESDFDDEGRIGRIKRCLVAALADLETLRLGKGES